MVMQSTLGMELMTLLTTELHCIDTIETNNINDCGNYREKIVIHFM